MILVDVYIPAIDNNYDFLLDENVEVEQIMTEIIEMVAKKVRDDKPQRISEFMLCSMNEEKMLERGKSLYENGITDGCKLLLI